MVLSFTQICILFFIIEGGVCFFLHGPDPEMTPIILDILDKYHAKAVFFLIGDNAVKYPEVVREIVNRGHLIGGHTLRHPANFGVLGLSRAEEEIMQVVGWNIRSYDTINKDAQKMLQRIIAKIKDGSSILLHDRVKNTVEMLPDILEDIQNKKLNVCPEVG